MAHRSRFVCAIAFVLVNAFAGFGQVTPSQPYVAASPVSCFLTSWESSLWRPVMNFFKTLFEQVPAEPEQVLADQPAVPEEPCGVAPLDPITDPAAQHLEASSGSDVVDVENMVPAAARALDRFQSKVEGLGGTIVLKSAYRPASYQKHLQNVWYKWMDELRNNNDRGCQALRAQVQDEFTRHRLIETQHPVAISDHTRGLAFDATVALPASARIGRRRMTLDGVARLAGLMRPAIAADPVHFKFLGGVRSASVKTAALRRRANA
ncbi:MAG TPA: hypothetical protein VFR42_02605 [Candidatus Acidoferrum sp.]|nr:hypothetical protein [Candidatus Acidoferrum sp.]